MLGLATKKCRPLILVIVATVAIFVVLVQSFFLVRLFSLKTPSEDKNSIHVSFQFLSFLSHNERDRKSTTPDSVEMKKSPVNRELGHKPAQKAVLEGKKHPISDVDRKSPSINVDSHNSNSDQDLGAPNALPQQRASLNHHHVKRQHLNQPRPILHTYGREVLVETNSLLTPRPLTEREQAGSNILFTLRTTVKFHKTRLPLLFDTWLTKVNRSNVFLVTDEEDKGLKGRDGTKYVNVPCRASYNRDDLCCKAGTELSLMFREDNLHYDWLCHVDDDIYVLMKPLVEQLSKFHPREEPVYFGRSGSPWSKPRKVIWGAKYGKPGQLYHFAVGGMYCLSRAMLELAKPYLVGGKEFAASCNRTLEPEDVTVGVVVGVVLNQSLSRTEMIYTHGLSLQTESWKFMDKLDQQIAYAYGYGSVNWGGPGAVNHIYIPHALFSPREDESQFYSLHCFLYPSLPKCVEQVQARTQSRHKP